jgi:hypothetical protein
MSSRRVGASEDLPRRREYFVREDGILDRAGERQCADNSSEGGDGPPTPGGGGAPKEAGEPFQLSTQVGRSAGANSFASARHVSAQRGQRTAIRAIGEMAFGQIIGNEIGYSYIVSAARRSIPEHAPPPRPQDLPWM